MFALGRHRDKSLTRGGSMNRIEVAGVARKEFERVTLHEVERIVAPLYYIDADNVSEASPVVTDRRPPTSAIEIKKSHRPPK